jgi:single-strand DNA-binding protein
MANLNRIEIIGNCGKEPEMRFTTSGKPVVNFSVAVNSKYGEQESTEWFNVVAWNKLAENCNQFLIKGRQVFVEGRLQTRTWDGQDGQKHYRTEIIASKVLFLGKRDDTADAESPESTEGTPEDAPF